jgi:hypothetical protein
VPHPIRFLSAVLLISPDAPRLASFYREILGIPLEEERHEGPDVHYGCELGDVHFAIHPASNFEDVAQRCPGTVNLAFAVFDMEGFVAGLKDADIAPLYQPRNVGFATMTALRDPDGNYLEFTELSENWLGHLAKRRERGNDIVSWWKAARRIS